MSIITKTSMLSIDIEHLSEETQNMIKRCDNARIPFNELSEKEKNMFMSIIVMPEKMPVFDNTNQVMIMQTFGYFIHCPKHEYMPTAFHKLKKKLPEDLYNLIMFAVINECDLIKIEDSGDLWNSKLEKFMNHEYTSSDAITLSAKGYQMFQNLLTFGLYDNHN